MLPKYCLQTKQAIIQKLHEVIPSICRMSLLPNQINTDITVVFHNYLLNIESISEVVSKIIPNTPFRSSCDSPETSDRNYSIIRFVGR